MKIKKGDIIKIINTGSIYPTYVAMAEKLGADFDKWQSQRMGSGIMGTKAIVLNINKDKIKTPTYHILIEMIEGKSVGEQYVIGKDGIEVDIVDTILDNDLFEI